MIPQDAISEIFESARVEEVIQDYVTLKKRGVNMIGNCPFHNEKTPSFTVSPTKGIYKCFGCGKAGNSVNFMMEHEQMTYPEALRYLANKYNIEIEEKELSPEQKEQQSSRESLQIVNSYAQKYFTQQLLETDEGKSIGLSYFKERGYSMETIERFQLGYNPDVWNGFTSEALKQGYKEEFLLASGLTKGEPGKRFDFFKGRVMFPIHTITGRVIAFGGRTLRNDKKTAKYFNSPESELYNKSKVLYGLYFAKKDIVKKDVCYLVEGYTDVISLHQRGIENVVSSSGTSLTVEQIKLIKRYTPNITMLFDGDVAGIKASFRGIDMILKEGLNVKVVLFPDGEDPDSYAKKLSQPEMEDFIETNSKDFIMFRADLADDEIKEDPIKRTELINSLAETLSFVQDELKRNDYIKLCSERLNASEKSIHQAVKNNIKNNYNKERNSRLRNEVVQELPITKIVSDKQHDISFDENTSEHEEFHIVRLLMSFGNREVKFSRITEEGEEQIDVSVLEYIIHMIEHDDILFTNKIYQRIFNHFSKIFHEGLPFEIKSLLLNTDPEIVETAITLSQEKYLMSDNWKVKHKIYVTTEDMKLRFAIEHAVLALQLKRVEMDIAKIQDRLKEEPVEEEITDLLSSQLTLIELKKIISDKLNRVILK